MEMAHNLGVKLISYEDLMKNSDVDLFISFDNLRVGELQGRYLIEKAQKGNYIVLEGSGGGELFKEGAMEYIEPLVNIGNVKIVIDKKILYWDPQIAYNVVKDALKVNNNKISAILSPNDTIARAVIEALKEQNLAGKVAVTGQDADIDAIRRIIQGTQLMTVFKDTRELGKAAIDAAIKLANGEYIKTESKANNGKKDIPVILIKPIAVDKNNIENVLIESGYYKEKDVNIRKHK